MSLDTRDFRRALGKFATGVTVVTTRDADGEHFGVTASSFNAVSMDPPLILWSIDKGAYSLPAYRDADHFVVNVLSNEQVDISNRFASRGEDKFSGIDTGEGVGGVAKMKDAAAHFECRTWNVYEGGDHLIIVGEVVRYSYRDAGSALVFHNGRYAVPEPHPMMLPVDEKSSPDGRLGKHLLYLMRQALAAYRADFYPRLGSLGVNDKEWRVLTLLADRGPLETEVLGRRVAQPLADLDDTLNGLLERDLVAIEGESRVTLSEAGRALALRLLTMADDYEKRLLEELEPAEVDTVKTGLGRVIERLGVSL
ncbi:flavin reductase [Halomonas organivorans]|uniref:Flavin reductase (DIM6/NTAB) family NADH-FMN oxidoreductase RutF/DNA-binding MarR family transcriptional regulator n=1 Tax=Halomonas organivorans TaxID=257772 RepID=A0A7W5BWW2_9GAMM|nr:flavin reductase [Halomonas organivorans]MBB3139588.1 flavin reductase (DIM6/NTAB) family NADH-FMN oxidoreductase RutF/DNA-binding MarR family transcriptional regulator [Halomonas organivorans]